MLFWFRCWWMHDQWTSIARIELKTVSFQSSQSLIWWWLLVQKFELLCSVSSSDLFADQECVATYQTLALEGPSISCPLLSPIWDVEKVRGNHLPRGKPLNLWIHNSTAHSVTTKNHAKWKCKLTTVRRRFFVPQVIQFFIFYVLISSFSLPASGYEFEFAGFNF